jgi:hypothetical protein
MTCVWRKNVFRISISILCANTPVCRSDRPADNSVCAKTGCHASLRPMVWLLVWLLVGVVLSLHPHQVNPIGRPAALPSTPQTTPSLHTWVLEAQGMIGQPKEAPAAHASNLVALPDHPSYALAAFWFAGSKEARPDVRIAMSLWQRQQQTWTPPVWVIDRHSAGAALGKGILHIGNPVAWLDRQQRLHVFVVGTGLGGWAAARVLHVRQRAALTANASAPDFEVSVNCHWVGCGISATWCVILRCRWPMAAWCCPCISS